MTEHFYIAHPAKTNRTDINQPHASIYYYERDGDAIDVKWSGKIPVPAVGDRIYMSINSIGYGEVTGYSDCAGWLGLMVKPEDPPDWWKKQRERYVFEHNCGKPHTKWVLDGICCVFGAEVSKEKGDK